VFSYYFFSLSLIWKHFEKDGIFLITNDFFFYIHLYMTENSVFNIKI